MVGEGDDIAMVEKTSITGKVVDEKNEGFMGVTIRVKSLVPCFPYGVETTTNKKGEYTIVNMPPGIPLEVEVSSPDQPSAFYQTVLRSNKQGDPKTNYFPFQVTRPELAVCIALAPRLVNVSGHISFNETDIPIGSEALVRLKSLDDCDTFDEAVVTQHQSYAIQVPTNGAFAQLTSSFPGRTTVVRKVSVTRNDQDLPNANSHDVTLSASPVIWETLDPVWTAAKAYPSGVGHLE